MLLLSGQREKEGSASATYRGPEVEGCGVFRERWGDCWSRGSQESGSKRYNESTQEAFPYNLPGTILRVSSFTDIRSYWSVLRVLRREWRDVTHFNRGFLNLSSDNLGSDNSSLWGCPEYWRMFSSISGLYLLEASSNPHPLWQPKMSPDIAKWPLGGKSPLGWTPVLTGTFWLLCEKTTESR